MKNSILVLLCVLVWASCRKKENPMQSVGEVSVLINGYPFTGLVNSYLTNTLGFKIIKYKDIGNGEIVPWENFGIGNLQKSLFAQQVFKDFYLNDSIVAARFATAQDDGDVLCDYFEVLESDSTNNWVQITREENGYQEIWGKFSVTMIRTDGCASSPYPDTLRFREGSFHVRF